MTIFISVILVLFLLEMMADYGLKKMPNTVISQWDGILKGNINSEIVILGSSRGFVSYDPEIIEKFSSRSVYNLSMNAGSYKMQQLKYELYREKNLKPKILIQNVDIAHFSVATDVPEAFQFIPYLSKNLIKKIQNVDDSYRPNNGVPLLKYNNNKPHFWRGIKSFFGVSTPRIQDVTDGFHPYDKKYVEDVHNFRRLRNLSFSKDGWKSYKAGFSEFEDFIEQNVNDSIKIILVWAPEYQKRYHIVKSIADSLKKDLKKLEDKSKYVTFVDMSTDSLSLSNQYFYDSFHLNKKGAILFSKKLGYKIKKLVK